MNGEKQLRGFVKKAGSALVALLLVIGMSPVYALADDEGAAVASPEEQQADGQEGPDSVVQEERAEPVDGTDAPELLFEQSCEAGGVTVTVRAAEGAFPEGAQLEASLVADGAEQAKVESAVQAERAGGRHVAASYVIAVSVLDADGAELQPADGAAVEVSFAAAEAADQNLTAGVYHVREAEGGVLEAEALDVTEEGGAATAATDGFSYYTVEFTYNDLQYVMEGGATVALADILAAVGLSGEPSAVSVSNPELFSAEEADGAWAVTAHRAFATAEWMKVTIGGVEYEITVTDDTPPSLGAATDYNLWVGGVHVTSAKISDEGWSYDAGSNTLTLKNYKFSGTGVADGVDPTAIYYAPQNKAFRIVLEGANSITQGHENGGTTWGIYSRSDFTIGGTGSLDVKTADGAKRAAAIYSEKNLEITGGTINATSGSVTGGSQGYGIGGGAGTALTIGEGAKVALAGPKGATNMTVKNAALGVGWADAAGTQGKALVKASELGQDLVSYQKVRFPAKTAAVTFKVANGSWDDGTAEDKTVTLFGAEGDTLKLAATDIPAVGSKPGDGYKAGTWDTAPSTETAIAEATTYTYTYAKKEAATVAKPPVAEELTYSGQTQALVAAGTAEGGTMQYAIGADDKTAPTTGWSASIPTGTDAGTYYVWYKAVGDEDHLDSKAASVTVTIAPKPTYSCTSGDGASWTKGSSDPLTFVFKRSVDDSKTYKAFKGAKVDGADVPESAYAKTEGSLVLSMTTTYLETLSAGGHELTAVFEDGEATAKFTVNDAKTRPAAAASSDSSSPKTGDALPVATLAACAALGAAVMFVSRARIRKPVHVGKHVRSR